MKKTILCFTMGLLLIACGSNSNSGNGKTFAPKDRTTSQLSDAEREAAVSQKKAELNVDIATLLAPNNVKLSVLSPLPEGDITPQHSEQIAMKMLEIVSQNGIGGVNNVPGFALAASITANDKKVTGTAPQKMLTTYTLSCKVMNITTGDVFESTNIDIQGAGSSFEEATQNAIKNIKNTPALQTMLANASNKIISWYEENLPTFKNQVETAKNQNNYVLALALVESVPQKAITAFAYATEQHPEILEKFQQGIALQEIAALKRAISQSGDELSADVYAHLQMLPQNSTEYKEAKKLVAEYEKNISIKKTDFEKRQIAKEEADAERAQAIKLAEIEAEKMKVKYQSKATEQAMRAKIYDKKGFFASLGDKILGGLDFVSDKVEEEI